MFDLICTVRNCGLPLTLNSGLKCDSGHHFDRAKSGYWNLTQPQDKKSLNPGDADEAVDARHEWLALGYGTGLTEAIRPWLSDTHLGHDTAGNKAGRQSKRVLDLGCGEGTFGNELFDSPDYSYCGIDLSKKAIKLAASRFKQQTWVMANADRLLPVADNSVHWIVSLFGRRPIAEIKRALCADGKCIIAIPGQHDLLELRQLVQEEGKLRNRWQPIVDEFAAEGMELVEKSSWKTQVDLTPTNATLALRMTYRAVRNSQQQRLSQMPEKLDVTLEADLLLMQKS